MAGDAFQYGLVAALAIALLIALATDLRYRRIGNRLNAAIALGAPLFWIAQGLPLWPGVAMQVALAVAVFFGCALLFRFGLMGGGDVKLLAALALWVAPALFAQLFVLMALIGGVLTIVFATWHVTRRRPGPPAIPYGIAIALAALWVVGANYGPPAAMLVG